MVRSLVPAEEAVGDLVHRAQYDRWTPRTCLSCLCCKFHVGYYRPTYHVRQSMSCQCSSRDEMRCQPYLLHGYVGNAFTQNQDPTQEDPQDPGPPEGSKEATGTASPPKAPKQAKNTPKSTQKHQKAPRMVALGFRQRHQRERGRAETESETNYVLLAYWPLAVCVVKTLTIIW